MNFKAYIYTELIALEIHFTGTGMKKNKIPSTPGLHYQILIDEDVKQKAAEAVAQGRTLDLKNDIVFKSFFSKDCVESDFCRRRMLSAVIGRTVTEAHVLNPEILPTRMDGKFPRLDIHCRLDDGSEVDVEIQNSMYKDDQVKRSIYYATTLAHNALTSGDQYALLPHIYQIQFMNFTVVRDKRLHHSYVFKERKDHAELSDIIQIHYIELPKIDDALGKPADELSELEFWVMLIMAYEKPEAWQLLTTLAARKEEMDMAQALLKTMSRDQQEWENQFGYERFIHDCISREQYAYTQGEQRGIEQGEYKRALEAARRMLNYGDSVEKIADITQLSIEEIRQLQKVTTDEK